MLLKDYLQLNNIKRTEFAYILGVHPNYVSIIIKNKKCGLPLAKEIEQRTGGLVTVEDLCDGKRPLERPKVVYCECCKRPMPKKNKHKLRTISNQDTLVLG